MDARCVPIMKSNPDFFSLKRNALESGQLDTTGTLQGAN
jgi:hypothetical protein